MRDTVLIITDAFDLHADVVVSECNARGIPVFRFHPREYPRASTITLSAIGSRIEGEIATTERRISLDRIACAWYRRPATPQPPDYLDPGAADYARGQATATLQSLYAALDNRWVVSPFALRIADVKLAQLARAAAFGLSTPDTIVTNVPETAEAFRASCGGAALTKPIRTPMVAPHLKGGYRSPRSRVWRDRADPSAISCSPTVYQPYFQKQLELRCVVIGEEVFAAGVDSQSHPAKPEDVRTIGCEVPYLPHEVPEHVRTGLVGMVKSFGISFASADFILTPEGEYIFLDLNPNGQWLWLDKAPTSLPLTSTFVDFLQRRIEDGEPSEGGRQR